MTDSSKAFFTTQDDHWFTPTNHTRGPWNEDHCHAGPPTGLIARALERLVGNKRLTRITVDLLRPIPFEGFSVSTEVVYEGRTVTTSRAAIIGADGRERITATAMHITEQPETPFPTSPTNPQNPDDATVGEFPIRRSLHGLPAFNGDGVEVKYPKGHGPEPGSTCVWMRTVPLLATETPSAFQQICPLADCGNALSRNAEPWDVSFVNTDLTVVLHRDPVGEWLGAESVGHWQPNGHGLADSLLFDRHGPVGRAAQTLLLRKNA